MRRDNFGFVLAKATQRWNELLAERFKKAGYGHVRPSYGAILVPLFEEDGLRLGELAKRARLSKQTMTTMVRLLASKKLVRCRPDESDARATRVYLSEAARRFRPIAESTVADLETVALKQAGPGETELVRSWLKRFANL